MNAPLAIRAVPLQNAVHAVVNYLAPMAERPRAYTYQPDDDRPLRTGTPDAHTVIVYDARELRDPATLDAEGFALTAAPPAVDFTNPEEIKARYYPAVEAAVKAAAGARRVIMFDHNIRNAERMERGEAGIRAPVKSVHNDFTVRSGRERAFAELASRGEDAAAELSGRFALVNLWRPIGRKVERSPLALADARSLAFDDLVPLDLIYRDRVGETYAVTYSPRHRWYSYSRQAPDEAVLIKVYDSSEDVARFSAHTAFEDPDTPDDAPARESIEARTLVIF